MSAFHTLPRLHVPSESRFAPGSPVTMTPEQARYLGRVLRREEGGQVRLFNAQDGEWLADIVGLGAGARKEKGSFAPVERLRPPQAEPGCVLAFALLKRDATDLVIRMGTELGVTRFVPLITERTVGQRVNGERLDSIATEAAEQCERLTVPEIMTPVRLTEFLGAWHGSQRLFVAVERLAERVAARESPNAAFGRASDGDGLLIGPEGGFSRSELDVALARPFVTPITLGSRVLRAETAAAAGLALLDSRI